MARNPNKKKVEFQIEPELYDLLEKLARREDRSVASYIRIVLRRHLEDKSLNQNVDSKENANYTIDASTHQTAAETTPDYSSDKDEENIV